MIIQYGMCIAILLTVIILPVAYGETIKRSMEAGMDVSITYPDTVISGQMFSISILVENNGWEDKQNIEFKFDSDLPLIPSQSVILIDKISDGGSYGTTIDFDALSENENTYFLNIDYSQTLIQNNEIPLEPFQTNIAIPIVIKDQPKVKIYTITPESIFTNAEFPFEVEIISEDIDLYDLNVKIIPPQDIEFRGETMHTFSSVEKGEAINIRSEIITPKEEVNSEFNLPFQVTITYTDHLDNEITESNTVPLILRPRTFMEITTEGGLWIGDFFIAPYVSLGTIIGIPAGALLSLLIKRSQKSKKRVKKKK